VRGVLCYGTKKKCGALLQSTTKEKLKRRSGAEFVTNFVYLPAIGTRGAFSLPLIRGFFNCKTLA
jgi:hypothetical protein